jgi:hypothetical protein
VRQLLLEEASVEQSRNGPVLRLPQPLETVYRNPRQRVLFNKARDANPFFHLFEALWMLAGRCDVDFVAHFVQRMREYSDDGRTLNGAYGRRWRSHFGLDQLNHIIEHLVRNPQSRRATLVMWDPATDLNIIDASKDVPCNLVASFSVRNQRLEMTVFNRSNDLIWGAFGANAVHFSLLQEYVACAVELPVGEYRQISLDAHVYVDNPQTKSLLDGHFDADDRYYTNGGAKVAPLLFEPGGKTAFDVAVRSFINEPYHPTGCVFIDSVAIPLARAHRAWRNSEREAMYEHAYQCLAPDWRIAAVEWLERR